MHRIKGITPWEDSELKVKLLKVKGKKVLDICTGLGYTAILSLEFGAREVISIEKDENMLRMAEFNPWSKELEKIKIINDDALAVVNKFSPKSFDRVLLDPPREVLARELYSRKFYSEILRILKDDGKFVHYVGRPGVKKGKEFWKVVNKRLRQVGIRKVEYNEESRCLVVEK